MDCYGNPLAVYLALEELRRGPSSIVRDAGFPCGGSVHKILGWVGGSRYVALRVSLLLPPAMSCKNGIPLSFHA